MPVALGNVRDITAVQSHFRRHNTVNTAPVHYEPQLATAFYRTVTPDATETLSMGRKQYFLISNLVIYNVTTGLPSNIGSSRTELLAGRFKPEAVFSLPHLTA
jgi:hypothetical protein